MVSSFNKTEVQLESLTNINLLLMDEKVTRGGLCHAIYQYSKS